MAKPKITQTAATMSIQPATRNAINYRHLKGAACNWIMLSSNTIRYDWPVDNGPAPNIQSRKSVV